jgi:cell division protein FtsZ
MKTFTKIKVVGVGGSGSNVVARMRKCKIKGVELVAINTDIQDLRKTKADLKLRIGRKLTQGLGTGMNPEIGRRAALENRAEIQEIFKDTDMVFVAGGMGGGTCTGAAPVVAQIAKDSGALTIAIVTKPFSFEGSARMRIAERGIRNLKEKVDTLILISNDKLLSILDPKVSLLNAFWICDDVLRQAVKQDGVAVINGLRRQRYRPLILLCSTYLRKERKEFCSMSPAAKISLFLRLMKWPKLFVRR